MSTVPRQAASPRARSAGSSATSGSQRKAKGQFPPGPRDFSLARTRTFAHDPLSILLPLEREHGPIFSVRLLHTQAVFMLGPEANTYVTVQHPEKFHWRESSFGDLIPLLGDGLLTIDGAYHDRARRIMMPAFHREHIIASVEVMFEEAGAALADWRPGQTIDVYEWTRNLAMRIAMRALLGLDPDDRGRGEAAAQHFEQRALLLRDRLRLPPSARPRLAVAEDAPLAKDPRRDPLRGDPPAARLRLRTTRSTSSDSCSRRPTRTARSSRTRRCATRRSR